MAGTRVASFQVPIAQWGNQPFTVPDLSLGDLRAEIDVEEGAAVFKEFKFKFSDGFFQRNPKFRVMDGVADMQQAKAPEQPSAAARGAPAQRQLHFPTDDNCTSPS